DLGEDAVIDEAEFTFTPDDNATYVATVTITDDDSAFVQVSTDDIVVANVAPVVSIDGVPETSVEGSAINVSANVTDVDADTLTVTPADAGSADTFTYAWSVTKDGDAYDLGETTTNAAELTFTPGDNGTFVATSVVTDDDGASVSASSEDIVVNNVAPTASIT